MKSYALDQIVRELGLDLNAPNARPRANGGIPEGQRNSRLMSFAGSMRRAGMTAEEIEVALRVLNERCSEPLRKTELRQIANSVARYETGLPVAPNWPIALNLEALSKQEPKVPAFIVEDFLPVGYLSLMAGHGGSGKSLLALQLAVCVALGLPFFGLPVVRHRVLFLSCEDRVDVVHWRLAHICRFLHVDMASLHGRLEVIDLVGHDTILWAPDLRIGQPRTAPYDELSARVQEYGTELLIVDGVADVFGGNENARGEVKRFVNALLALIPPERGAVLLVGHVSKATTGAGASQEAYAGSTGWNNAPRCRWALQPVLDGKREPTGEMLLELQKSNLGKRDRSIRLRWSEDEHLFVGAVGTPLDRAKRDRDEQTGIASALRGSMKMGLMVPCARTGRHTGYHELSARPEFPGSLRGGKEQVDRFWRHIDVMRQRGEIRETEYRKPDGHKVMQLYPGESANAE